MKIGNSVVTLNRLCNTLELAGVLLVLLLAFAFQFIYHELPCPLCLFQRLGFFGIALGFLMNRRFGFRPSHYAVVILSALFTSYTALRQIALHVLPGTPPYGDPILDFHLYTWSYISAMVIITVTTLMMGVDRQYQMPNVSSRWLTHFLFGITGILIVANLIAVFFECGLHTCPSMPTHYLF